MAKSMLAAALAALVLSAPIATAAHAETFKEEMKEHPRIVKAIRELEDAIKYMEAAPHDFGGHKAKAIADSRAAIAQLREAIKFRLKHDTKH